MSTGSHDDHLDALADASSIERRRWFERAIMLPVSLGTVIAFLLYAGRDLLVHFGGQAWPLAGLPDWALFALTCAIALGALWLIRR